MAVKDYPIATSQDEFARLGMQSDLFRGDAASMLERIGVKPGWRCLDLCCGIGGITDLLSERVGPNGSVTGADMDPVKLDHARDWAAAKGYGNIRFVQADAFATQLEPASFDLVHTRFALSVISKGLGVLDHMLTLVRPGGIVFVEEANTKTMECFPGNGDWDRALDLLHMAFERIGANVCLGPLLYGIFLEKGLADLAVRPCIHAIEASDPMAMHMPNTMDSMREALLSLDKIGAGELDALIERLRAHLSKPDTLTISYSMIQVVGRAPG